MLEALPVPSTLVNCPTDNMINFKEMLEKLKTDANDSQAAAKSCYSRIKFLVDSTENNSKMFADLRKGEVKVYQKAKETFSSRIKRYFDTRHKIESLEHQISQIETDIFQEILKDKELQNAKIKVKNLHQTLLKTKVEFTQMKIDAKEISLEFNQTKNKFVRVFNAYAENVEHRVRDNLAFFVQKIGDFLNSMKLNNSPAASKPHSSRGLEENATRSHSSTEFNLSQLSTQLAENKHIIEELKFEEEKISDPDLYLKFVNFLEHEPKQITKEIEQYSMKIDNKRSEAVFRVASDIVLGRATLFDLIFATKESLDERSLGIRIASFLIILKPKYGRIPSKKKAENMREEILRCLLRKIIITSLSWF